VFLFSESFPFNDEYAFEIERFMQAAKTVIVYDEMFSWYKSKLLKVFDYFKFRYSKI